MGNPLARLVPGFIRRRYLAKFVVSMIVVGLVIGGIGAYNYVQVTDTIEDDTSNQLQSTAKLQSTSISDWVKGMEVQTKTLASDETLRSNDPSAIKSYLNTRQGEMSQDVRTIHYVDLDNESVVTTTGTLDSNSFSDIDSPWATAELATEMEGGNVWVSESSFQSAKFGKPTIAFAAPVDVDGDSEPDRAVVVLSDIRFRVGNLNQELTNQSTVIVNRDTGETVLAAEDASVSTNLPNTISEDEPTVRQENGYVKAYTPVEGTDWVAVTSVPTSDAFLVRDQVGQQVLFIIFGGMLTLGVVSVVLGRQTVPPLIELRNRAEEMETGNLEVDLETSRSDEIGQLFVGFANMRDSLQTRIQESRDARESAEQARERTEEINRHLEQKAQGYQTVMQECAAGDLTRRMDPESQNDSMSEIAHEFNDMMAQLEATTAEVKNFANTVATHSEEVTASSEEVNTASRQVTESIQQISDGAERQNESLNSVNAEMDELSTTTEEIAASSNEVADIARRTAQTGQDGRAAAEQAIQRIEQLEDEREVVTDRIRDLESEVEQIDELVDFITGVAEQTNMLALNANIEASRGGGGGEDDGAGFAVVAQEVKDLAAETKEAASDVEERLEQIKAQTNRTAEGVEQTTDRIAQTTDAVRNAAEALDEIAEYAQETNTGVQGISAATEEQAATTQEVVAIAEEASTISEETTAEAENVAAAAEQQTSALSDVTRSANDLADRAGRLSDALDRFETDTDSTPEFGAEDDPVEGEDSFDEDPFQEDGATFEADEPFQEDPEADRAESPDT